MTVRNAVRRKEEAEDCGQKPFIWDKWLAKLQGQQAKRISSTKLKTLATNETVCSESRWGGLSPCVSLSLSSSDSKGE